MKKAKLSTKFILLFTAVLTGIFAVMLAVVQLSMTSSMRGYIGDNLDAYHGDVDSNVVAAIDEVAYAYARIVRDTNADALQDLNSDNGYAVRMRASKISPRSPSRIRSATSAGRTRAAISPSTATPRPRRRSFWRRSRTKTASSSAAMRTAATPSSSVWTTA